MTPRARALDALGKASKALTAAGCHAEAQILLDMRACVRGAPMALTGPWAEYEQASMETAAVRFGEHAARMSEDWTALAMGGAE